MASFKEAFAKARKELGAGKTFTWNGKSYTTDTAEDKVSGTKPKARPAKITAQSGAAQSGTSGKVNPLKATGSASASTAGSTSSAMTGAAKQKAKDIATKTQVAANKAAAAKPKPPLQGPPKPTTAQKQKAGRVALKKTQDETRARMVRRP